MIDPDDLELLRRSAADPTNPDTIVRIVVNGCAYSCCGKPWRRRDGYEQDYIGYIQSLDESPPQTTFTLFSAGIGTLNYVVAVRGDEVELVERNALA